MIKSSPHRAPDRAVRVALSSGLTLAAVMTLTAATSAFAQSPAANSASPAAPSAVTPPLAVLPPPGTAPMAAPVVPPATAFQPSTLIANAIDQWKLLQSGGTYSFGTYAAFLTLHRGWPGETAMRKAAERQLSTAPEPPAPVVAFFRRHPPLTAAGRARFADALWASGASEEAKAVVREAWADPSLPAADEARLLASYGSVLTPDDHDARMDQLLWARATASAARQLGLTSAARRAGFALRLALLAKAPDAGSKLALTTGQPRSDAGLIADIAWWYRQTGNVMLSRQELAKPRTLAAPPRVPLTWLKVQYEAARNAANDYQWDLVYQITRQAPDAYPAGTSIRDRSFEERDVYTNLTWLGGMTSLTKRGRPADAVALFDLYAQAARSPQTQAKGLYWAGRAAEAAGQRDTATRYYERAAVFFDQFHGQLSAEKLSRPVSAPAERRTLELSGAQRMAFENSSVVKAASYLGTSGQWQVQTQFIRAIAANAQSDADHFLASELAAKLNRPDLGVLIGRSAREDGFSDYTRIAFPQIKVPDEHAASWTMIHAITRQESQFDREARSPVGARGLMQLMPGTARDTSEAAGVSYDITSLTGDPQYNIRLGSTYFGQLMDRYGGSYLLAVAAYNAGPGNVNKWLRANGDPRLPGADVLGWIEAIPLSETRGYVQRVLENAVVYGLLNPARAPVRTSTPLSTYLGKTSPG